MAKRRGKPFQSEPATEQAARSWFRRGCQSIAAVGGKVSGGLLIIDFDEARFYPAWLEQVGTLADGLPVQQTGREGGGYQVWLRCPEPGRNDELAHVPDETEYEGRHVAIETRAEGGYAVMPGSLHPSGRRYQAIAGDFTDIPIVAQAVADALIAAARKLDEAPLTRQQMDAQEKTAATSTKYRSQSNGQASVIDAYNEQVTIDAALTAHGYTRIGECYARPGGVHPNVKINDGKSFHWGTNDPLCDKHWHRPFDVFCHFAHGDDCSQAVRAAAKLLGMNASPAIYDCSRSGQMPGSQDEPSNEQKRIEYRRISCAELDAATYDLEYLIDRTLVAGQPCIVAGGKKCLKTSIIIDMGVSLAVGGFFLGKLRVNRACRVGIMTGESGLATIQETARRICRAAGHSLGDISGLVFSEDLPRFGSFDHEDALRRFIEGDELEVVAIDPAYLAMPGGDAGNLFVQGDLLRGMTKVCTDTGCMMMLAHHARKTKTDPFSPPELEDIAWAGFQEFARQWLLVGRREAYEPGTGEHRLWLSVGGSAGHTALWALNIAEGTRETEGGRFWQVAVMHADEACNEVQDGKEADKQAKASTTLERDKKTVCNTLAKFPEGDSKTVIRDTSGLHSTRFNAALSALLSDGTVVACDIIKGRRKTPIDGYKLKDETPNE
jgi:hypothetical protein